MENLQITSPLSKNDFWDRSRARTGDPTANDGAPVPNLDSLFVGTRKDYSNYNRNSSTNISKGNCNGGTLGNIYANFVQRGSNNLRGTTLSPLPSCKMNAGNLIVDPSGHSSFLYENEVVMKERPCSSRNRQNANRREDRTYLIQHRMKTFCNSADRTCSKPPNGMKKSKVQKKTPLMNPTLVCILHFFKEFNIISGITPFQ